LLVSATVVGELPVVAASALPLAGCTASQLSAMDVLVQAPMKGAAKCDKHRELQNSVNQWNLERSVCS
jgi:hypothetical protein